MERDISTESSNLTDRPDPRQGRPSCSELHRVMRCPGYWGLRKIHGKPQGDKAAAFGDDVHAMIAESGMDAEGFKAHVATQCDKIRNKLLKEVFPEEGQSYASIVETRMWLEDGGAKVMSGQPDFVGMDPQSGTALLVDYKTLSGRVDPVEDNWQLLGNLVCLQDSLARGEFAGLLNPFKQAFAAIIQPSVTKEPVMVSYTHVQIEAARSMILTKLAEAEFQYVPRIPGSHCKDCPVACHCPEAQALTVPLRLPLAVDQLTPDQIVTLMDGLPAIESICKSIRRRAKDLAKQEIPGFPFRIKMASGDRYLVDLKGVREAVAVVIDPKEFATLLTMPFGALKSAFVNKLHATGKTKKAAGMEFDILVEPFTKRKPDEEHLERLETEGAPQIRGEANNG